VFDVFADGERVFCKAEEGDEFPEEKEVVRRISARRAPLP